MKNSSTLLNPPNSFAGCWKVLLLISSPWKLVVGMKFDLPLGVKFGGCNGYWVYLPLILKVLGL